MEAWLEGLGVNVQSHHFTLRPYSMELLGLWLVPAVILPPAPTNLEACRESGSPPNVCNYLSWTGSAGVTYNVYSNSTSPVPIDAGHRVTSGITETNYTDCGTSPGAKCLAVWPRQTAG